jgi:hypothetical protein
MAKRSLNETVFGIHGIHPNMNIRDEQHSSTSSKTAGKIVLKKFDRIHVRYDC